MKVVDAQSIDNHLWMAAVTSHACASIVKAVWARTVFMLEYLVRLVHQEPSMGQAA